MLCEALIVALGRLKTGIIAMVLQDKTTGSKIPIFIGPWEAYAIFSSLHGPASARPMTHDLLKDMIGKLGARLEEVVITEFQEDVYLAVLSLDVSGERMTVDCRPSDAIALAVRLRCPIKIEQQIFVQVLSHEPTRALMEQFDAFVQGAFPGDASGMVQ